jgi:hypothetical protein
VIAEVEFVVVAESVVDPPVIPLGDDIGNVLVEVDVIGGVVGGAAVVVVGLVVVVGVHVRLLGHKQMVSFGADEQFWKYGIEHEKRDVALHLELTKQL